MTNDPVKTAKKALDNALKSDPRAAEYQRDIDCALAALDDPMDRLTVLMTKILHNTNEMNRLLEKLNSD